MALEEQRRRHVGKEKSKDDGRHCFPTGLFGFILLLALCVGAVRALFTFSHLVDSSPDHPVNWRRKVALPIQLQDEPREEVIDTHDELLNLVANSTSGTPGSGLSSGPYHFSQLFFNNYRAMKQRLKVFIYPTLPNDPFKYIFLPDAGEPSGNYASEGYFKKALTQSGMVTDDPSQADLFFMPFSISGMRTDKRIGPAGIKAFVREYTRRIKQEWSYWNRTGGSDHFYVVCHSIGKSALDEVPDVRWNAIQVVCSSNYFIQGYIPHKDVPMPQIWPRTGNPKLAGETKQRKALAFFAGGSNSPVRAEVVRVWKGDPHIQAHPSRVPGPYSDRLLHSKFCLHIRGYEVNTARIGDAMYYGCVPVIIANHYELSFNNVLDWSKFSVIVTTRDISKLKSILSSISPKQYERMHKLVMQVRQHFQWHSPPVDYDAFYMVMYQLWQRRHTVKYQLSQ